MKGIKDNGDHVFFIRGKIEQEIWTVSNIYSSVGYEDIQQV